MEQKVTFFFVCDVCENQRKIFTYSIPFVAVNCAIKTALKRRHIESGPEPDDSSGDYYTKCLLEHFEDVEEFREPGVMTFIFSSLSKIRWR